MQVYKDSTFSLPPIFPSATSTSPNTSTSMFSSPQHPYNPYAHQYQHYYPPPAARSHSPTAMVDTDIEMEARSSSAGADAAADASSSVTATGPQDVLSTLEKLLMGISPFPPTMPTLAKPTCPPVVEDQIAMASPSPSMIPSPISSPLSSPFSSPSPLLATTLAVTTTTAAPAPAPAGAVPSVLLNEHSLDFFQLGHSSNAPSGRETNTQEQIQHKQRLQQRRASSPAVTPLPFRDDQAPGHLQPPMMGMNGGHSSFSSSSCSPFRSSRSLSPPTSPFSTSQASLSPAPSTVDSSADLPSWSPSTPSLQYLGSPMQHQQSQQPQANPLYPAGLCATGPSRSSLSTEAFSSSSSSSSPPWNFSLFDQQGSSLGPDLGGHLTQLHSSSGHRGGVPSQRTLQPSMSPTALLQHGQHAQGPSLLSGSGLSRRGPSSSAPLYPPTLLTDTFPPIVRRAARTPPHQRSKFNESLGVRSYESGVDRGHASCHHLLAHHRMGPSRSFGSRAATDGSESGACGHDNQHNNCSHSGNSNNTENHGKASGEGNSNSHNGGSSSNNDNVTNNNSSNDNNNNNNKSKSYPCPTCSKPFPTRTQLKSHIAIHVDHFPFPCLYAGCDLHFKRKHDLRRHVDAKHALVKKYLCTGGCGEGFGRRDQMVRHLRKGTCRAHINQGYHRLHQQQQQQQHYQQQQQRGGIHVASSNSISGNPVEGGWGVMGRARTLSEGSNAFPSMPSSPVSSSSMSSSAIMSSGVHPSW